MPWAPWDVIWDLTVLVTEFECGTRLNAGFAWSFRRTWRFGFIPTVACAHPLLCARCAWSAFWWARGTDHRVASSAHIIEVPHGCCEPIHWQVQCSVLGESRAHKGFGPSVFAQVSTPAHNERKTPGLAEWTCSSWAWVWVAVGAVRKIQFSCNV